MDAGVVNLNDAGDLDSTMPKPPKILSKFYLLQITMGSNQLIFHLKLLTH
jgi:hypothetical protein